MVDIFDHKTEESSQKAPLIRKIWNAHAAIFYGEWSPPFIENQPFCFLN
jgi:hypothetical protein